jgi:hypothetical protein
MEASAMKYWRLKLKGKRSAEELEAAVGSGGGQVVRVHMEKDEATVYFEANKSMASEVAKSVKRAGKAEEIGLREIKKLR